MESGRHFTCKNNRKNSSIRKLKIYLSRAFLKTQSNLTSEYMPVK